ncbi:hypothetical protein ACQKPX_17630 [Photobacterium sp. DNB23_23_1]|uniref:Uncharacterized protein n=1 Tax=Photobacterium pectinilyticum TaxID=2906793 RepID=A0ABT1N1K6_9GAMM|nr:hypothetical protein [Photobacterium sp. ZSDE20]MCQ1058620.1 hypothetical protein [Photobacterium sp. ZSDE20]MDD1824060.1 hypothetical protein [Photobacterium sp. ZSDE20]
MKLSIIDMPAVHELQALGYTKSECLMIIEREIYRLNTTDRSKIDSLCCSEHLKEEEALDKIRSMKRTRFFQYIQRFVFL